MSRVVAPLDSGAALRMLAEKVAILTGERGDGNNSAVRASQLEAMITGAVFAALAKSGILTGEGNPEGKVAAKVGTIYRRNDGALGSTLYVKNSGADETGWAALPGPATGPAFAGMKVPAGTFISNLMGLALTTLAGVADRMHAVQWLCPHDMTIDQLGLSVSVLLAGSNAKVVLYASDALGRPSNVIVETANIDCATTGTKLIGITPQALTANTVYWLAIRTSGTQTYRAGTAGSVPAFAVTNAATPLFQSTLSRTLAFATAANAWPYASSQHQSLVPPLVLMRVA